MKTKLTLTAGAFDGGVVPSGPLTAAAPVLPRVLTDEYLAALSELLFEPELRNELEDRKEIEGLLSERMRINARAQAIITRLWASARGKVAAAHEEAKAAVREAQARLDRHREESQRLGQELNRLRSIESAAVTACHEARAAKQLQSRFASRGDVDRVKADLAKAEAAATAASEKVGALQAQLNMRTMVDTEPLQKKLNELLAEEIRLNHLTSGTGYTSPEGLVVPQREIVDLH
jgi:hypothetical protein